MYRITHRVKWAGRDLLRPATRFSGGEGAAARRSCSAAFQPTPTIKPSHGRTFSEKTQLLTPCLHKQPPVCLFVASKSFRIASEPFPICLSRLLVNAGASFPRRAAADWYPALWVLFCFLAGRCLLQNLPSKMCNRIRRNVS